MQGQVLFEINRCYLYWGWLRCFVALVARPDAQQLFPGRSPGTLAANLIGGYIIGVAVAFFATATAIAPEWRLFVITGFCGGLTTFSTFSSEVTTLLQQGRALNACGAAAVHLVGSVLMTFAGIGTVALTRS
jgi:CrcB protein